MEYFTSWLDFTRIPDIPLIEFHKSLYNINPSEIRVPLAFLKWKLAEIVDMYDKKTINEKYEDY